MRFPVLAGLALVLMMPTVVQAALVTSPGENNAAVLYDAATGNVSFNLGSNIGVASLVSENGLIVFDSVDTTTALGAPSQTGASTLAFSSSGLNNLPEGCFSIGNLLPAGLEFTLIDLPNGDTFSAATRDGTDVGRVLLSYTPTGSGSSRTAGVTVVTAIPEPGSALLLAGLATIAAVNRRQRKATTANNRQDS
ncbi:MAG: PEP-CTERM sorting domain-containing protein [Rubripirellula sp.]